jgi:hypothetical protein
MASFNTRSHASSSLAESFPQPAPHETSGAGEGMEMDETAVTNEHGATDEARCAPCMGFPVTLLSVIGVEYEL